MDIHNTSAGGYLVVGYFMDLQFEISYDHLLKISKGYPKFGDYLFNGYLIDIWFGISYKHLAQKIL